MTTLTLDHHHDVEWAHYTRALIHQWSRTLAALGFTLIPIFFILDYFMMPQEQLTRFALYRLVATTLVIAQFMVLRLTQPAWYSFLHGYVFSLVVAGMVALMTTDLSGFGSTYYAGLNLVMIAANLLLPWRAFHSAINGALIIGIYVLLNLAFPTPTAPNPTLVVNNMYFLSSTAVICVAINWVKERLIREEFMARRDLRHARDALWGEMEVAKHIQTSLAGRFHALNGYRVAAASLPAQEVGGDYYDIIASRSGQGWVSIGDVSGHGVESGLIMMMAQTSIYTAVNGDVPAAPFQLVQLVNSVITENISRLKADRYMTLTLLALGDDRIVFAGKHQDLLVFRRRDGLVETIPTTGTWLGVVPDLSGQVADCSFAVEDGDVVLMFSDGVTEATNPAGEMFGQDNLTRALQRHANRSVEDLVEHIMAEVRCFMQEQRDDLTLLALKRDSSARSPGRVVT